MFKLYKKEWIFLLVATLVIYGALCFANHIYSSYFMNNDNEAAVNLIIALLLVMSFFLKIIKNRTLDLLVDFFTVFITIVLAYRSIPESKHIALNTFLFVICALIPLAYIYTNILVYGVRLTNKLELYYKQKNTTNSDITKRKSEDSYFSIPANYMEKIESKLKEEESYEYFFKINIESQSDLEKIKATYNLLSRYYDKRRLEFKILNKENKIKISWPIVESDD